MLPKRQRLLLVGIIIGLLGITGALILIKNYAAGRVQIKPVAQTFSGVKSIPSPAPSWNSYFTIGKHFKKLEQNLAAGGSASDISPTAQPENDGENLDLEAINSQTNQIEHILKEEVDFKLLMLNNNIKAFEKKLSEDKNRKIKDKSSALSHSLDLLVKNKEKEIADLNRRYEQAMRSKYKDELCNLQLQLSVIDLMDKNVQEQRKEQIKAEIDRIHQEIAEKLSSEQQERNKGLIAFKTEHINRNEAELTNFMKDLETNFQNQLSQYKDSLGEEFKVWYLNREKEVADALELRQEQQKSDKNQQKSN